MKIALVHDDLIQEGGAEKLLLAMHEIWPEAPLYTSFASAKWVKKCRDLNISLQTSFMQKLPFKLWLYKIYFFLYPLAFEAFNFDEFDVVLSSSARYAHGVLTKPKTRLICYMNTPGRMWWESASYFGEKSFLKIFLSPLLNWLRLWDFTAAQRVNLFIANSKTPQAKIRKYYGRESEIVYPFAELNKQQTVSSKLPFDTYYLVVTRLVPWKRVDIAIEACKDLHQNLVIVGRGPDSSRLKNLAQGSGLVRFFNQADDAVLVSLYNGCRAVIITQAEDFGIVTVEAAKYNKPVIAFKSGGSLEIVKDGKTGEFFFPQTKESLAMALQKFNQLRYDDLTPFAEVVAKFSKEGFKNALAAAVHRFYALPNS